MISTTSTHFIKNFGHYSDEAQREPVAVTNHGRISGYFLSAHEYDEYQRIKSLRQSYTTYTLPDEDFKAIIHAKMDSRHDHLNSLMDKE